MFKLKAKNINVLLRKMASHPFSYFCFLLIVSVVASVGFFIHCESILTGSGEAGEESVLQIKKFNAATAKKVFDIWKQREQEFKEADSISYPDLFKEVAID